MHHLLFAVVLCSFCGPAFSQTTPADEALLTKTRALYDAPFSRNLVSFDCAVQFDWRKHFVEFVGTVPPAAEHTVERLQTIQHRVFVDRSGSVVSAKPKPSDLTGVEHAVELEQTFKAMIPAGLSMWLPFSINEILPIGSTKFNFQKIDPGYKIVMNGPGVAASLLLSNDLRLTSIVSQMPQAMRATTEFASGPDGFLLTSITTAPTTDSAQAGVAAFTYTYQTIQGFQLPSLITITQPTRELWQYTLTDCKVMTGVTIDVRSPHTPTN